MMWTLTFWRAAAERGIKTFAQTAAAMLVAAGTGLIGTDYVQVLSVAGMAALVSVLSSVGSGVVTGNGPSLGGGEKITDPPTKS